MNILYNIVQKGYKNRCRKVEDGRGSRWAAFWYFKMFV